MMQHSHPEVAEYIEMLGERGFKKFGTNPAVDSDQMPEKWSNDHEPSDGINDADLVISRGNDMHYPVIDLDVPAMLIKSTTEGHSHLYINVAVPWTRYVRLLEALVWAGIVEPGYVNAAIARGYSAARLPWIRKNKENETIEEKNNVRADESV
jgi:hypothetical protein